MVNNIAMPKLYPHQEAMLDLLEQEVFGYRISEWPVGRQAPHTMELNNEFFTIKSEHSGEWPIGKSHIESYEDRAYAMFDSMTYDEIALAGHRAGKSDTTAFQLNEEIKALMRKGVKPDSLILHVGDTIETRAYFSNHNELVVTAQTSRGENIPVSIVRRERELSSTLRAIARKHRHVPSKHSKQRRPRKAK